MKYKTLRFTLVSLLMMLCGTVFAGWQKTETLTVGDVVIMAGETQSATKELTAVTTSGTTIGTATNYTGTPAGTYPLTIVAGSTEGSIAFKTTADTYLSWSSGNSLTTAESVADASSWTVAYSNGFTVTNVGTPARILQYNASNPRFACYGNSGQTKLTFWKQVEDSSVATPTFTPNGGTFVGTTSVEIACETEGAKIYYTLDGTDPTAESTEYTAPFTVTETTTVKAIAIKGDDKSSIATASFTAIPTYATLAAINALENNTAFGFTGEALVVAKPTAKYVYIKDNTGSSLIYDATSNLTGAAEVGKTIATNWTGKVKIYNNLFEMVPDAALVMKEGDAVAVEYPEVTPADITAENINKVVTLKGITTYTVEGQNIAISVGENNVVGYNQFGLEIAAAEEGKTYKMVGAISCFKENIQFQPISIEEQVFEAVDCTAKVDVNGWKSDIGTVGNYTKDVAQKEQYLTNTTTLGEVLYQTVEGLENGNYTVELYANASYTAGRGFASVALNGDKGRVVIYAGDVEKTIPVIHQTAVGTNNIVTLENVVVSDGTLKMGLRKDIEGSNWHTIQIKALTQTSDKAQANAEAQNTYWVAVATELMEGNYKNVAGVEKAALVAAQTKADVKAALPDFFAAREAYDNLVKAIADAEALGADASVAKEVLAKAETTAADAVEALHPVKLAVNTAKATEGADMTFVIVNPSFETGNTEGWTYQTSNDHGAKENSNGTYSMANCDGNYLFNIWSSGNAISQVIEDLPNGTYKLSAIIATDGGHKVQLNANDKSIQIDAVDKGTGVQGEVEFNVLNHKATIGAEGVDKYWYKVDNFRLTYVKGFDINGLVASYEEALRAAQAIEGKMNKDVKTALDAAIATEVDKTNPDSLSIVTAALTDATAAAKASVAAFANATNVLPKMKELTDATNVYTAEALAEYYTQWLEKYEAETLTTDEGNALQDPSIVTGWHASITVDNFLLSAWDTNPDFQDAAYYINSWSTEGDNDGSNFRVPFFEYWTGDGDALGEKTLTATMNGVEPGDYDVTAWVRVRAKNGYEAPAYGIKFAANGGDSINVCDGAQIGTSQFYLKDAAAKATVGEDGVLKIQFVVAADNNISWLSFKNVKFEKQEAPATTYTVTVAETQNGQVEVNKTEAAEGETVSVTVTPAEGYMVDEAYWTYGEGENVTKTNIEEPSEGNAATFIMPAANVTVTVTFKAVAAELEKFYIMGTGTANEWNGTTEMAYNEEAQAFEYTVEGESGAWIAFGDVEFTNWDDFNANHRYAIGEGDQDATIGEAMQLQKVNGTLALPAGKYNISVTKDLLCTITEVVAPATHTWDFTKWSEATIANLKADAAASKVAGWSDVEKKVDAEADADPTEASKDNCFWATVTPDENGELAANGVLIEELKGLAFNPTYSQARSLAIAVNYPKAVVSNAEQTYEGPAYLWLGGGGKNVDCFVIKNVKAGTQISMGVETHKIGDARGIQLFVEGAEGARGDKLVAPDGSEVAAPTAYTEQTWAVPGEEGVCNIIVYNTKGCHIYFIDADIEYTYTVAGAYGEDVEGGAEDVVFGKAWDPTQTKNDMVKQEDGTYKLTITGVELQNDVTVYYKVVKNHSWDESWGFNGENANYKVWEGDGKYTITFTFDPNAEGDKVSCEMVKETPTGITMLKAAIENGIVYNMNGQKVNKAQKGLYIINGRKVVIK